MASTRNSKNKKQPGVPTSKYILGSTPLSNGTEYIIQKYKSGKNTSQVYLADVFDFMPPGFLYKDETGMGATTLELQAKRHSIIVEPIKITASSKAHTYKALYVGSPTKYHKDKSITEKKIKAYVSNTAIKYKKIIVVADSLSKVINAIGPSVFQDYFLLIDEIDSFQIDSTFRRSMEEAVEYYKMFEPAKRALLSATMIKFSDNQLANEPVTIVKYNIPHKREINVLTTSQDNLLGLAADYIKELIISHPTDKIFVAYNSVSGILSLVQHLLKSNLVKDEQVKVLCSSASKDKVLNYYHELDSDLLPGKLNFFTSAYFTGYDLKEKYHLVSISGNIKLIHVLSEKRLKQIVGRCRPGVYTEAIIHDTRVESSTEKFEPTLDNLLEAAKHQAQALACVKKQYQQSPVLKIILSDFSKKMMAFLEERTFKYVRENISKEYVTSYFNIDAELEVRRVIRNLYEKEQDLYTKLVKEGHNVQHTIKRSLTYVEKSSTYMENRKIEIDYAIEIIEKAGSDASLYSALKYEELTSLQRQIITDFIKVYNNVDKSATLSLVKEHLYMKDSRKYNSLMLSAKFHTLPKGNLHLDRLDYHFPVQKKKGMVRKDEKLSAEVIKFRMDHYLAEINYTTPPKDAVAALKLLKIFRKVSKRYDKKTRKPYFVVTGENPFKVPIVKKNPAVMAEDFYTTFFSYG